MAYLFRRQDVLARRNNQIDFFPIDNNNITPLTVGFVDSVTGNLSSTVCPRRDYFILMDDNSYLSPNLTPINIPRLAGRFRISQTLSGQVLFDSPMYASFNNLSAIYSMSASKNYQSVGYNQALPIVLSTCQLCGCPPGMTCSNTSGACIPSRPCQTNGFCVGKCFGRCPSGSQCVASSSGYSCIAQDQPWFWGWLVMFLLFMFLLIGVLIYIGYQQREKISSAFDQLTASTLSTVNSLPSLPSLSSTTSFW